MLARSFVNKQDPDKAESDGDAAGEVEDGPPPEVVGDDAADRESDHGAECRCW